MDSVAATKVEKFFKNYRQQEYKKGEILIRADDDPTGAYYLKKGMVKMYVISRNGDEHTLNIFKPGTFFPMSWVISDIKNRYFFEALTDILVYNAPKQETRGFAVSNVEVLSDLLKRIYIGLDGMFLRMEYLMSGNAYGKFIAELVIHVKRFGIKNGSKGALELNITERDLSTHAGITRETVSREMKILKEKGLVTFSKRILIIPDITKLEEELQKS